MEEMKVPDSISPDSFPAKLWELVNSPRVRSVLWDACGCGLLVYEQLFVWEVLGAGPGGDEGPRPAGHFKTKSFCSFIRQLNLYGFHKVAKAMVMEAGADGGGGGPSCFLHHFQSPYFLRGRPDLLVHLKRLTKANKAKLAAGLELPSRPQRLRTASSGLLTTGQVSQPGGNFLACSYTATSAQNHGTLSTKSPEQTPVPSTLQQSSPKLLPQASSTFSDEELSLPRLQKFLTEVTYSLQHVISALPFQQESQRIPTHLPEHRTFLPSVQYSQACCPSAALQSCSAPAHTDPLPDSARPAAPTYTHCSFFPENTYVKCESNMPEMEERQFTSETETVNKSIEETDSSVEPRSRKRRHSLEDESPDLHLLEGRACKQGYFPKEETRE